jgi:hypothetical protein
MVLKYGNLKSLILNQKKIKRNLKRTTKKNKI